MASRSMAADAATVGTTSRWRVAAAIVVLALPLLAIVVGSWMWWNSRSHEVVSGDLGGLVVEASGPRAVVHPLVAGTELEQWSRVADGAALGRDGSGLLDDARSVFSGDVTRRAVPVAGLRDGTLAWASPRTVRIVQPGSGEQVAQIDICRSGVDGVVQAGERLVVAACGRLVGIGPGGAIRWRTRVQADGGLRVIAVGDGVLVASGDPSLQLLDARDGARRWKVALPAPARTMRLVGSEHVAVATSSGGTARVIALRRSDGSAAWQRRWRGWNATAMGTDGRRVVVGLALGNASDNCGDSGLVELDAATGASGGTRKLDRRLAATDLRADGATGRMAALLERRGCTLQAVEPRIDLFTARGLARLHQVALPARPCSGLVARRGLVATATCEEIVAIDARSGRSAWNRPLEPIDTRRRIALVATHNRLVATDDVGTLAVVQPRRAPGAAAGAPGAG